MKSWLVLMAAVMALGLLAEAAAQTVIDATGLKVNGEAVTAHDPSAGAPAHRGIPGGLWLGQSNGYLWSCDLAGACTLQADLGQRVHSMAVFNSRLWLGHAGGEVRSCDGSGVCREFPRQDADIASLEVFAHRLWMGLGSGELKSCDGGGACTSHGDQGEAIVAMAVFDGRLWIGQEDGRLRACDRAGTCTAGAGGAAAVLVMAPFGGRLWVGQGDGVLKSCDGSGVCTEHDRRPEAVRAMAVFDGKLWVGRGDGYLKVCDAGGACGDLWDYGDTIDDLAVYNGRVWMAQGSQLRSAYELGTFEYHGDFGSNIDAIAAFAAAGLGRTIHSRWNCVGTDQGCVGIGTANPVHLLQVHQADEAHPALVAFTNPATGGTEGNGVSVGLDAEEDFRIHSYEDNNLKFYTKDTERLRIDSQGNVGIGTEAPAGRLDVNGPIYHRGAKLHADYVFDPSYEIESIEAHADYMWRERHLAAVPRMRRDADGMEVLEVGAHRRGMLEELEKAHVYIHQLNEQVKVLQARNAALESVLCEMRPDADLCADPGPSD